MQASARCGVCVRSDIAVRLTPSKPLELAVGSISIFPQSRLENVLEHFFGTHLLETLIEHQTPDDPAAEAKCVKPRGRVTVERLCIRERLGGFNLCGLRCGHAPKMRRASGRNIR